MQIIATLKYPLLTLLSTGKKSFANMGRLIQKSGDAVSRYLQKCEASLDYTQKISQLMFSKKKKLFLIIDDTLIKKFFSQYMEGSGSFFDQKIGRRINAYKLVLCMISDGRNSIPIGLSYLISKELLALITTGKIQSKEDIAQAFMNSAIKIFPSAEIIILADGLYATVDFLRWCLKNKIAAEMRMHSNRVVIYKGRKIALKELIKERGMRPKGRKMVRTISVIWHDLALEISIVRRIDKHGKESIVFQVATYKALPREHLAHYKKRWYIEKCFRTMKQSLGLQECFSTSMEVQQNHVAAVCLAYALAQFEMKNHNLENSEEALRRLKMKKVDFLERRFMREIQIFSGVNA